MLRDPASESAARPTLLAIDDEPGTLVVIERFAERFGFAVVSRTDATTALAELPATKPDVVLVDPAQPQPEPTKRAIVHASCPVACAGPHPLAPWPSVAAIRIPP